MPEIYDVIKQYDLTHPVTYVTVNSTQIVQYMPYIDVMQADYYCIPPIPAGSYYGTGFRGIIEEVNANRAGLKRRKTVLVCLPGI